MERVGHEGDAFKGWVVALGADEVRIELELASLLEEGNAVEVVPRCELPLRGDRIAEAAGGDASEPVGVEADEANEVWAPRLRGSVVSRVLPMAAEPPSVLIRLTEAPPVYHERLAEVPEAATLEIEIEAPVDPPEPRRVPAAPGAVRVPAPAADRRDAEPEAVAAPQTRGEIAPWARDGESLAVSEEADAEEAEVFDPSVSPLTVSRQPRDRAKTLFVAEPGALQDLTDLVCELGGSSERVAPDRVPSLEPEEQGDDFPDVLVVDSAAALSFEIPDSARELGLVSIAIADARSHVLSSLLWRLGFDYVVRRPVHPEVVRLLFQRALYRGGDLRAVERVPIGRLGRMREGLRRRRCTVLDLSEAGCRLAVQGRPALHSTVRLHLGSSITRGRPLQLRGKVVRRRVGRVEGEWTVGVRFGRTTLPLRRRLRKIFTQRIVGPTVDDRPWLRWLPPFMVRWFARGPVRVDWSHAELTTADAALELASASDRRELARVQHGGEVLSLRGGVVHRVLMGRDLSVAGMRVEPHPDLGVGELLRVSLYDLETEGPLVIDARVDRCDGDAGAALSFQNLSPKDRTRLESITAGLPMVESLNDESDGPERLVVAGFDPREDPDPLPESDAETGDRPAAARHPGDGPERD